MPVFLQGCVIVVEDRCMWVLTLPEQYRVRVETGVTGPRLSLVCDRHPGGLELDAQAMGIDFTEPAVRPVLERFDERAAQHVYEHQLADALESRIRTRAA